MKWEKENEKIEMEWERAVRYENKKYKQIEVRGGEDEWVYISWGKVIQAPFISSELVRCTESKRKTMFVSPKKKSNCEKR